MAGARAAIEYLQDEAGYSRIGHHGGGAGRWIDAHEFVVAQFLQHDSRDRDPQLHVHQAILNRVLCSDGSVADPGLAGDPRAARRRRGDRGAGDGGAPDPLARGAVRDPPRRQGAGGDRRPPGRRRPVLLPPARDHSEDPAARRRLHRSGTGTSRTRCSAPASPRRPPWPPAARRRTRGSPPSSAWIGGTPSCAPRSATGSPRSLPTCSGAPSSRTRPRSSRCATSSTAPSPGWPSRAGRSPAPT